VEVPSGPERLFMRMLREESHEQETKAQAETHEAEAGMLRGNLARTHW
jgi:hypothetical protein